MHDLNQKPLPYCQEENNVTIMTSNNSQFDSAQSIAAQPTSYVRSLCHISYLPPQHLYIKHYSNLLKRTPLIFHSLWARYEANLEADLRYNRQCEANLHFDCDCNRYIWILIGLSAFLGLLVASVLVAKWYSPSSV